MHKKNDEETSLHEIINANPDLNIRLVIFKGSTTDSLPSWHNSLVIIHLYKGILQISNNDQITTIYKNDIAIIDSRDIHHIRNIEPTDSLLVQVPYSFLKNNITEVDSLRFSLDDASSSPNQKEDKDEIKNILNEIYLYNSTKSAGYALKTTSLVYDLLFRLYRSFRVERKIAVHSTEKYSERLAAVTEFIKANYRQSLSLQQMAEKAYLNPEYFLRFFKKYMGLTPLAYLTSVRLQKIADDLVNTDHNITHLSVYHGCGNYKLFLRQFKDAYGCSPVQYRREKRI